MQARAPAPAPSPTVRLLLLLLSSSPSACTPTLAVLVATGDAAVPPFCRAAVAFAETGPALMGAWTVACVILSSAADDTIEDAVVGGTIVVSRPELLSDDGDAEVTATAAEFADADNEDWIGAGGEEVGDCKRSVLLSLAGAADGPTVEEVAGAGRSLVVGLCATAAACVS